MVMSVQSSSISKLSGKRPVAPPRRCRNKDSSQSSSSSSSSLTSQITPTSPTSSTASTSSSSSSATINTPTPSSLAVWVSTHPRRVNRSISETATTWLSSNNYNDKLKTVSLERTRLKGLPPNPVVHQPVRTPKPPTTPATIPRLPAKRGALHLSAQRLANLNIERIPNLPVKTLPRLPPKEKKETSNLNSGILNPLDKKEPPQTISLRENNEIAVSIYEEIKPSGPEFVKVTPSKDSKQCCTSLPKRLLLDAIEESKPHNLTLVNHLNTLPKPSPPRPLLPPENRSLPPPRRGVPPIPRKSERAVLGQKQPDCFTTSASSRIFDLSTMNHNLPSLTGASSSLGSNSRFNSQKSSVSKQLADDTNDISLLNDDSYEPDFGHLILLQGGVEAIHAALQARKERRSTKKRGDDSLSEKSQLTVETDSKLDDAGYEVPASEDRNSPNDSDPTYEEVTFHYPQGNTRPARRWRGNPRSFFNTLASVFRSKCCACNWRLKATSYRFTKGSTWDWQSSEIPITTKGSRSSELVSRVRNNKRP